jgi:hypothetical protein
MKAEHDIIPFLPCITAEIGQPIGRLRRASVVYLRDPQRDLSATEAECYGFDFCGNPVSEYVPWERLRHPQIRRVRTVIGKHCQRMTEEDMHALLETIRQTVVQPLDDFSTGLEEWE